MVTATFRILKAHWYLPVAALILVVDSRTVWQIHQRQPQLAELGFLADVLLLLPFLAWLAYRGPGSRRLLKPLAIACAGVWLASRILPPDCQHWLPYLRPLRWAGLAVLLVIELRLIVAVYRRAFGGAAPMDTAKLLHNTGGVPHWLARLMAQEAALVSRITRRWRQRR